jgi:bacteriorhodopsin
MLCVTAFAADASAAAPVETELSENGKKFLWVAFVGLAAPCLYFAYKTFSIEDGKRYYHIITTFICMFASLAYLTMATGHGVYTRPFDGREFFYARYIDWALTTPLQLLDLLGFAGADTDTTCFIVGIDILMIVAGLIGAFFEGQEKWAFWGFGMLMFVPIVYYLLVTLKEGAAWDAQPEWKKSLYNKISMLTAVSWACYPVVWMFAEGSNKLSADTEAVAYTILDILSKSVFGFLIVSARETDGSAASATQSSAAAAPAAAAKAPAAPAAATPVADGGSML